MIKELITLCKSNSSIQTASQNVFATGMSNQQLFFQPIIDLLDRCKLQKTLLHCFYSTTHSPSAKSLAQSILASTRTTSSASTSSMNELNFELLNCRKQTQYSYMSELLDALEQLIQLERILNDFQILTKINRGNAQLPIGNLHSMQPTKTSSIVTASLNSLESKSSSSSPVEDDLLLTLNKKLASIQINIKAKLLNPSASSLTNQNAQSSTVSGGLNQLSTTARPPTNANSTNRYIPVQSICNQSMFISSVLHYLKNINLVDYHMSILKLIRNALPSAGNALKPLSTFVSEQLCRNLLQITNGSELK